MDSGGDQYWDKYPFSNANSDHDVHSDSDLNCDSNENADGHTAPIPNANPGSVGERNTAIINTDGGSPGRGKF